MTTLTPAPGKKDLGVSPHSIYSWAGKAGQDQLVMPLDLVQMPASTAVRGSTVSRWVAGPGGVVR